MFLKKVIKIWRQNQNKKSQAELFVWNCKQNPAVNIVANLIEFLNSAAVQTFEQVLKNLFIRKTVCVANYIQHSCL